jgi:DNA-binding response OmpR family regulator
VNYKLGILSANAELVEDFRNYLPGIQVHVYRNVDALRHEDYSALLIDIEAIEATDSVQFYLTKIRKKVLDVPVILILRVTFCESLEPDWFIDDFILYPFRKFELQARLKRLLWRSMDNENVISVGDMRIDLSEYTVYLENEKIQLTYKEFELLRLFMQNRGIVFSRKDLLSKIWGIEYIGGTRTVDVHIRRLRGKLGEKFDSIIETVRNVGYRCRESV